MFRRRKRRTALENLAVDIILLKLDVLDERPKEEILGQIENIQKLVAEAL